MRPYGKERQQGFSTEVDEDKFRKSKARQEGKKQISDEHQEYLDSLKIEKNNCSIGYQGF